MPELPEVETVVRGLAAHLPGKRIVRVRVLWPGTVKGCGGVGEKSFAAALQGTTVRRVFRRGKYICLDLDDGTVLTVHLRMSGQLLFALPAAGRKHLRLEFRFADGTRLFFVDARKFGRARLWPAGQPLLPQLGIEPLQEAAVLGALRAARSRRAVKTWLLDQTVLAGVGNIYADESLFAARIHPLTPAARLTPAQRRRLAAAVVEVLQCAVANLGTTLADFRAPCGEPGANQECLQAYGRDGEPCFRCGGAIARRVIGGRSSHFCPRCQKMAKRVI